jgi:hypothetical protein
MSGGRPLTPGRVCAGGERSGPQLPAKKLNSIVSLEIERFAGDAKGSQASMRVWCCEEKSGRRGFDKRWPLQRLEAAATAAAEAAAGGTATAAAETGPAGAAGG